MTTDTTITPGAPGAAASDLLKSGAAATQSPPPAPAWQPAAPVGYDAPEAVSARAEIKTKIGDREFYKPMMAERERGVTGPASQAWSDLHKKAFPSPAAVTSQDDVNAQASARNEERFNAYLAALKQRFPLTADQDNEIRAGMINEGVHAWAREEKDRLIKDREFRTKLLNGSRAENLHWGLVTTALSLRPVPWLTNPALKKVS
jgi:hypothetical protein